MSDNITLPREVAVFLCGEASLDGVWFGDKHPNSPGQFWWRKHLRAALAEPTVKDSLTAQFETLREENEQLRAELETWQMTLVVAITLGEKLTAENKRLREALEKIVTVYAGQLQNDGEYTVLDSVRSLVTDQAALRREDNK